MSSMSASRKENVKRSSTEEEEVLKKRPRDTRTGDQFKIPLRPTQARSVGQSDRHDRSVLPVPLKEKTGGWSRHDNSRSRNESSSSHHRSDWNCSGWDTKVGIPAGTIPVVVLPQIRPTDGGTAALASPNAIFLSSLTDSKTVLLRLTV